MAKTRKANNSGGGGMQKKEQKQAKTPSTPDVPEGSENADSTINPAPESAYDVVDAADLAEIGDENPHTNADPPHRPSQTETEHAIRPLPLTPPPDLARNVDGQAAGRTDRVVTTVQKKSSTAKDLQAVDELLETMKRTFSAMGATFDVLGKQTLKIAELGPAIGASQQISIASKQLEDHVKRQEQRMEDVRDELKETFSDAALTKKMQEAISSIAKDIVHREIAERVRKQLQEQVPQEKRDQIITYKRKILEVQTSLHNSEARRHNALIKSNSLNEPLKALLRPFGTPSTSPTTGPQTATPSSGAASAASSVSPTSAKQPTTTSPTDTKATRAIKKNLTIAEKAGRDKAENTAVAASSVSTGAGVAKPNRPTVVTDLVPPTPSPLFPRDLTGLMRLGPHETLTLMQEYGLAPVRHAATPVAQEGKASDVNLEPENQLSREDNINRFLNHIGSLLLQLLGKHRRHLL
ncbi:unnamed protein product [Somion occarium]|uniref:Uncharacterized protein n=1 Tax=Somion occarium TaxID=3059160 RepID=A0ABP1DTW2_9APHY